MNCVKVFRSTFKASYELSGLALVAEVRVLYNVIWSQSDLVGKCVQPLTRTHVTLYYNFWRNGGTGINPE